MSGAPVEDVVVTLSTVAGDTATGWAVSFVYYPHVLKLTFLYCGARKIAW